MKKYLLTLLLFLLLASNGYASEDSFKIGIFDNNARSVKSVLNAQIKYANKNNFEKFSSTYKTN